MKSKNKIKVFLVDDNVLFLKALKHEFTCHGGFSIKTFTSGELCLEKLSENPDAVILDYFLNSVNKKAMNGIETLDEIKAFDPNVSVVMLSAQDKIDVAVNCMHHGAFDYVMKSETAFMRLQKIITINYQFKKMKKELNWYMERM